MMSKLKTALIYGVIAGAIMNSTWWIFNALFMDMDNYDMSRGELLGYATMILAMMAVFVGVKNYRDKLPAQTISFGQAFLVGLYIVLVSGVIYSVGWMIYSDLMMPDFAEQYLNSQLADMQAEGATLAELQATRDSFAEYNELYKNPFLKFGITIFEIMPVGMVACLVSAFVLKKK